jgi:hypothetical protein
MIEGSGAGSIPRTNESGSATLFLYMIFSSETKSSTSIHVSTFDRDSGNSELCLLSEYQHLHSVADPDPVSVFDPWIRDPEWVKKQDPE